MEHITRKQRQKEKEATKEMKVTDTTEVVKMTEDQLFKEQKRRLRKQLNSVPTFSVDMNDMKIEPNALKKRTEIKKQKKIDEILKDIAVLPDSEYLNEDTNLRILKKMSVAKGYNRLRLSPEQEEKMEENKQKFETITNQLWFLIQDLEKRKIAEPEIGRIPTVSTTDEVRRKKVFDIEMEKTIEHQNLEQLETETEIPVNRMAEIEEKLEHISLIDDELEEVLQELEKVVQEGKKIAQEDIENNHFQKYPNEVPDDTLELLNFLQKIGEDKGQLTQEYNKIQLQNNQLDLAMKKPVSEVSDIEQTAALIEQHAKEVENQQAQVAEEQAQAAKTAEQQAQAAKVAEQQAQAAKVAEEQAQAAKTAEQQAQAAKVAEQQAHAAKVAEQQAQATTTAEQQVQAAKVAEQQTQATKATEQPVEQVKQAIKPMEDKIPVEKHEKIKTSIIVLAIVFLTCLLILCIVIAYMLTQGYISL